MLKKANRRANPSAYPLRPTPPHYVRPLIGVAPTARPARPRFKCRFSRRPLCPAGCYALLPGLRGHLPKRHFNRGPTAPLHGDSSGLHPAYRRASARPNPRSIPRIPPFAPAVDALRAVDTGSAASGPLNAVSPHQFSPLGNPPFLIPPPNSNTPRGGNRRGQQRGGFNGAAGEPAGPLSPRGAAPRRPSGCQGHHAAHTPLRRGPQGPGAQSGLHAVRALTTIPALHGVHFVHKVANQPPCAYRPRRGRARLFCCGAPAPRERAPAKRGGRGGVPPPPYSQRRARGPRRPARHKPTGSSISTLSSQVTRSPPYAAGPTHSLHSKARQGGQRRRLRRHLLPPFNAPPHPIPVP